MKNILLATTALVMTAGFAHAELTISGSARVGFKTTEGKALVAAGTNGAITTSQDKFVSAVVAANLTFRKSIVTITGQTTSATSAAVVPGARAAVTSAAVATGTHILGLKQAIADAQLRAQYQTTTANATAASNDVASLQAILALIEGTAAVPATKNSTDTINRIRVNFDASGTTDSGLSFGASIRADNAAGGNAGTEGSQYVSGAFGTISMGDLDGVDQIFDVSGVGVSSLGFTNELAHNSTGHNASWSYSASGLTIAASTDTKIKTGDNTAYALSYAMDAGGANVKVAAGTSKSGVTTQNSYGLTVGMNGLTLKASSSTNDNGPAVALVTETAAGSVAAGTAYVLGVAAKANPDTTQNAVSVSYAVDAVTMTAYTRDVKTSGIATATYTGFGVSYDLGGAKLVAGTVDANGTQVSDLGVSFSF
jgi:outer membrane protein OmpU